MTSGRARASRGRRAAAAAATIAGVLAAVAFAAIWLPGAASPRPAAPPAAGRPRTGSGAAASVSRAAPPVGTIGDFRVAELRLTFADRKHAGQAPIRLPVIIRYPVTGPAAAGPQPAAIRFPLVVFAPGYRQCDGSYRFLLREWASAGYIVAAVTFPRTNCHIPDPDENDLVSQPGEMTFVIRGLVRLSDGPRGPLAGLVDAERIAIAGHSDGGDTVAAVAANTCCRDHDIAAAMVLSGAEWPPMPGRYFTARTPPMLIVQGTADTWNPPAASLRLYRADTTGPRYYLDLLGADHFRPYQGRRAPEPLVARVTVDFLDRYLAGQRGAATAMRRAARAHGGAVMAAGRQPPP